MRRARSSTSAGQRGWRTTRPNWSRSRTVNTTISSMPPSTAPTSTGRTSSPLARFAWSEGIWRRPGQPRRSARSAARPSVAGREEVDEVADLGALGLRQPGEARVRRPAEPESPELVGEPRALDPPERLEELDEGDPGGV